MAEDIEKRIFQYIVLRDELKRIDAEYEEKRKPILRDQETISGKIQKFMADNNITKNLKTKTGTCYLSTRFTATVADAEAFMKFIQEGHWDMIERRANSTAVKDYVKEHNELPPGCNLNAIQSLRVLRAGEK